jgi:hypothetical protein
VAKANGEEITEEDEDEWYIRRIDAGLSVLQSVDYILAWIVMEDDGVSLPFSSRPIPFASAHTSLSSIILPFPYQTCTPRLSVARAHTQTERAS